MNDFSSLDLENSFIYFGCNTGNCWRASIKSTLTNVTDNKTFYLTKECRTELIGQYPFAHPAKSELCIADLISLEKVTFLIFLKSFFSPVGS